MQELGYVNERQVLEALAQRLQLTMIDIEHTNVDVTAVEKVPQELAQKYDMLPIAQSPRALTIAANDPLNYYALEDIRQLTGLEPEIVLAELEPLRRAIRYYYAEVSARKAARTANDSDMASRFLYQSRSTYYWSRHLDLPTPVDAPQPQTYPAKSPYFAPTQPRPASSLHKPAQALATSSRLQ